MRRSDLTLKPADDLRDPPVLARACADLLDEKKITDLKVFDVGDSIAITGFFVIGTGMNLRHLKTAVDHLQTSLKERGYPRKGRLEGYGNGKWILLDLGDVVVHLFQEDARKFYDLEILWGDAPQMALPGVDRKQAVAP
jgi:ribosome-associated protein